jgi:hypothetical protein
MDEVICYRFPKGNKSEVRAVLREYGGRRLAEFRVFTRVKKAAWDGARHVPREEWVPTPRGVAVPWEDVAHLPKAAQALADEVARQQGTDSRDDGRVDACVDDAH